jgi:hypothetical protein
MKLYGWTVTYLLLWCGGQHQADAWLPSSAATAAASTTIRRRHQQHYRSIERDGRSTSRQTTASSSTDNDEAQQDQQQQQQPQTTIQPDILKPFFPAANPRYMCDGPVGQDDFVVRRDGPPLAAELTNENLLKIVRIECSDLEVNTLVWKCMGYRFNDNEGEWTSDECFPNWRERFPQPPDFVGMQRMYVF